MHSFWLKRPAKVYYIWLKHAVVVCWKAMFSLNFTWKVCTIRILHQLYDETNNVHSMKHQFAEKECFWMKYMWKSMWKEALLMSSTGWTTVCAKCLAGELSCTLMKISLVSNELHMPCVYNIKFVRIHMIKLSLVIVLTAQWPFTHM